MGPGITNNARGVEALIPNYAWTTGKLLAYRVPVEFLDQLYIIEHLLPEWNVVITAIEGHYQRTRVRR